MNPKGKSEADVAKVIVDYLDGQQWDVYQEVKPDVWSFVADIVAIRDGVLWIIEVKTNLSFELMAQAKRWKNHAHLISVAVPRPKRWTKGRALAERILAWLQIGLLEVSDFDSIRECVKPTPLKPDPKYTERVISILCEGHKIYAPAGSPGGGRWTAFKETCRKLSVVAQEQPGMTIEQAVYALDSHHYAHDRSAIANLRHYLRHEKIYGIKAIWKGRTLTLLPDINIKEKNIKEAPQ